MHDDPLPLIRATFPLWRRFLAVMRQRRRVLHEADPVQALRLTLGMVEHNAMSATLPIARAYWTYILYRAHRAIDRATQHGGSVRETAVDALVAAQRALEQWPYLVAIHLEDPEYAEAALVFVTGWARQQVRLFPSLSVALSADGDPHAAVLEHLSESILKVWSTPPSGTHEVVRAIQRRLGQVRRVRQRRPRQSKRPVQDASREAEAQQEVRQRLLRMAECARLSPQEARVFTLRLAGKTYREIATALGVSMDVVKVSLHRAKAKLHQRAQSS
jgi:RNA polymerase sigma factor (sigma-70 family)